MNKKATGFMLVDFFELNDVKVAWYCRRHNGQVHEL